MGHESITARYVLANDQLGNVLTGKLPSSIWDGENPHSPLGQVPDYPGL